MLANFWSWLGDFWSWLAAQPPSSASFLGAVLGSALGLIAILLGALFNAHLNRRRDDRLRAAERRAVATALHAELVGVHRRLRDNIAHIAHMRPDLRSLADIAKMKDEGFLVPELSVPILPEVISNIGLLPSKLINTVMDAYLLTQQISERLILLGGVHSTFAKDRQAVWIHPKHAPHVRKFLEGIDADVQAAVDALDRLLKRTPGTG